MFFDWYLKGIGGAPPLVVAEPAVAADAGGRVVRFAAHDVYPIITARLWSAPAGQPSTSRVWASVDARQVGRDRYEASLPPSSAALDLFALVTGARGFSASATILKAEPTAP